MIVLNILWLILGGIFVSFGYLLGGLALCLTIIGIPWGIQCFKLGIFALLPFGSQSRLVNERQGMDTLDIILNVVWLLFGGIWLALGHILLGVFLCFTIIGLPFGVQHLKMTRMALTPFGMTVVDA